MLEHISGTTDAVRLVLQRFTKNDTLLKPPGCFSCREVWLQAKAKSHKPDFARVVSSVAFHVTPAMDLAERRSEAACGTEAKIMIYECNDLRCMHMRLCCALACQPRNGAFANNKIPKAQGNTGANPLHKIVCKLPSHLGPNTK